MRKVRFTVLIAAVVLLFSVPAISQSESDINAKVALLDIDTATLDDVIRIFGEPEKYFWRDKIFTKNNLPLSYIAGYPDGFSVAMWGDRIQELRFEKVDSGYVFKDKLRIGSSLESVLEVVGQPEKTVQGQPKPHLFIDDVLYKDIDGREGDCYYSNSKHRVRFFFRDYKVSSLYVTRSQPVGRTIQPMDSVKEFYDVRWKDLSKLILSDRRRLVPTLWFNQKTVWPKFVEVLAEDLLEKAMNPGLGVRNLHRQGITGKGVNVAIIDQPMYTDHPEFSGKIVAYHDLAAGDKSSMHGPAVTSLLVGTNCGTAPDARVYYVAGRGMAYEVDFAEGLDWIIEQNAGLPQSEKIRVVSVSASPGIMGTPSEGNQKRWNDVCARAEAAGILVLDCTDHHGFIGPCWYDIKAPESITRCKAGFPNVKQFMVRPGNILVPCSPRTTAEEYDEGDYGYQYCGTGGLSWSIPYCAGVLAMGWQLRPEIPPEQMRELLFESAYTGKNGVKTINPGRFVNLVKRAKVTPRTDGK